jgi:hypothetical protein
MLKLHAAFDIQGTQNLTFMITIKLAAANKETAEGSCLALQVGDWA